MKIPGVQQEGIQKQAYFMRADYTLADPNHYRVLYLVLRLEIFFNFLEAEGLDDDAIFAILSSNTVNSITGLRSGRDLQRFFSTGNEFLCNREKALLLRQLI